MQNYRLILSISLLLTLVSFSANAARVYGKVSNSNGEGLEFASIYVENSNLGATSNEEGLYELFLRPGTYKIVFQYVGYTTQTLEVAVGSEDLLLDVTLETELFMLNDIVIREGDRDPAYAIIKQAQAKRRYYLQEEIKRYECKVYVKGLQRLHEKPDKIMGINIELDTGIVYFSESLSKLSYQAPDDYKEIMIASKVSGDNQAFSFNQATDAWLNLYENIGGKEISERGIISPIASNALLYYRYRLVGAFYEGRQLINKIQVIPRRKFAPAYSGHIYITEDTWRIHSADLQLGKGVIEFIDSTSIQQVYQPVMLPDSSTTYLPLSQKMNFNLQGFGFKASGYFVFIYSDYEAEPTFPKRHFNREIIRIEAEANKKEADYWEKIRPLPLSEEEKLDYQVKDSIRIIKESKPYKDSLDRKNNRLTLGKLLVFGYNHRNSYDNRNIYLQPIFRTFQFNTVEGLVTDFSLRYTKYDSLRHYWRVEPTIRYGFANQRLQAKLEVDYRFNPIKSGVISLSGGQYVEQLSRIESITPFLNSMYSLLDEQNFMKLYEKAFARLSYRREIKHGLGLFAVAEYAERREMRNHSDYRWRDVGGREYTPNFILDENIDTRFPTNQALTLGLVLSFQFGQDYVLYPNRKVIMNDRYPNILLNYRKGIPALGSDVDYDFLSLVIKDKLPVGMLGEGSLELDGGKFLRREQLSFVDYRHFKGNQTILSNFDFSSFQLLDYYRFSTNDWYFKAHYEHHFNGFLLNGIPFLRRLKWQTVVGGNYLYTEALGHYAELRLGIEHIFKVLRVDFVTAWQAGETLDTRVQIGFGF